MPKITTGVPLIVTVDGLREQLDRPVDTETRLFWEMALDHGEATLLPLEELYPQGYWSRAGFTHRLTSPTGGVFHVRVEEMDEPRQWPQVGLPQHLALLAEMGAELQRMVRQLQTLLAANAELEARLREWEAAEE